MCKMKLMRTLTLMAVGFSTGVGYAAPRHHVRHARVNRAGLVLVFSHVHFFARVPSALRAVNFSQGGA